MYKDIIKTNFVIVNALKKKKENIYSTHWNFIDLVVSVNYNVDVNRITIFYSFTGVDLTRVLL